MGAIEKALNKVVDSLKIKPLPAPKGVQKVIRIKEEAKKVSQELKGEKE